MLEKELFNQVILLQIGAQDQSMNDNSTLALMHKIEMLVMIITQILCNGPIVMMIAKNVMILNDKKQCAVSCLQVKAALH